LACAFRIPTEGFAVADFRCGFGWSANGLFRCSPERAAIWQRVFPPATPTQGLDHAKLAKLRVAGGNIRNIAMNAAFIAADADEPVRMSHLLAAARSEYAKMERPLTAAESEGWV
jgi:hypothetical protein